jgi:rod shape-determining protein MreC
VIEYTKDDYDQKIKNKQIIVYTSGYGGLFKPGLPVGKLINDNKTNKNIVSFYSDFRQLDYVKIVSYDIGSGN